MEFELDNKTHLPCVTDTNSHRRYWQNNLFFTGGEGFGVDRTGLPICLGYEKDILAFLKGDGQLPHTKSEAQSILLQAKGDQQNGDSEGRAKRNCPPRTIEVCHKRSRLNGCSRHRPFSARRLARPRAARHKAKRSK